jgi:hypothetical protein
MTITTDFSVAANGDIRYTGAAHGASGAGYYTVIALHRWLQDLADDASSSGDDYVDITRSTPSDRSTDNIITLLGTYNIDQTASEHLYGGSIIQAAGADIWDGILVYANAGMDMQIIQNGAVVASPFWNTVPFGGSLKGLNADPSNGISHQFILKTRTTGADIDGRRLITQTRVWGMTYSEFKINGTARGNNVSALLYVADPNNTTAVGTVATWTTIANDAEGYQGIDVNNDSANEYYYSQWNRDVYTINQFYERMKWLSRQGSASTLYGLNGEVFRGITHEVALSGSHSGTFSATENVSWGTGATAGTGRMVAIDSVTAGTKMWIQLLTGVAPSGTVTITGVTSTATNTNSGTPTERALAQPFAGTSTGTALSGAFGVGVEKLDLSASDKVIDLTGTTRQAPNYVTFTLSNLVSGDSVLVGPNLAGALNVAQMTLNGALTGAAVTSVVVTGSIPADTPATGTIRILRATGLYSRHAYSAWTGSTFTIGSTDFSSNNAANGANTFVSYLDGASAGTTMAFTAIYSSDRSLFVRVRNGTTGVPKIKTYETTATLGSAGGGATTSRISDE